MSLGIFTPVFVGKTEDNEKIVLYRSIHDKALYILRPNGRIYELGPGAEWETHTDPESMFTRVTIRSDVWSGSAVGTKADLIEEPNR